MIIEVFRANALMEFAATVCAHYMSEKIWKAYGLGLVPVVFASHEATSMLPSHDSFIDARDFSSAVALREFLGELAQDETRYMKYFAWKQRPLESLSFGFQNLWATQV